MTTVVQDGVGSTTGATRAAVGEGSGTAPTNRPWVTRRHVQVCLGVLWLLDGLLQLQPYMFTRKFGTQVIAPTAVGQPAWVSWPVHHTALVIAAHPVPTDGLFALVQLALGVGLLWRRTARLAAATSVLWAGGVWFFGEGLGGLAGGTASLLTGGPGAAALYAVLALAAWPTRGTGSAPDAREEPVASWFPLAWAAIWLDGALLSLLPANRSASAVESQLVTTAGQVPVWLDHIDRWAIAGVGHLGGLAVLLLVSVPALIGVAGLGSPRWRQVAAGAGVVVALGVWVVGEAFGQLASGSATDPNTGPLLMLSALALLGVTGWRPSRGDVTTTSRTGPERAGRIAPSGTPAG